MAQQAPPGYGSGVRRLLFALLLAVAAGLTVAPATAAPFRTEHVETELHAARNAVAPGERVALVLRQRIAEGWHTYWQNPGESGEPTELVWSLPPGYAGGALQFPAPERIPFDVLVNYGYAGEVLFPVEVTIPASARVGTDAALTAHATWLVCSDICIMEEGDLALTLPIRAAGADDPVWKPRIDAAIAALPRAGDIQARVTPTADGARLSFAGPGIAGAREAHFFPFSRDAITFAAPEDFSAGAQGVSLALKPGPAGPLGQAPLEGVLTVTAADGARSAYAVTAEPGPALPNTSGARPASEGAVTLPLALALALLGGLILNIMPCVFPVLSLKALSLAGAAQSDARRGGLFFLAGVMATFLLLAGVLVALKAGGAAIGWGFQLQVPLVVASLSALFFVIGLNLAGVFEIGGRLQNLGQSLAARSGDAGAFFTGALAVIAATPCTAPFMASATGYAATQSAPVTLLVFAALGLGFAAPFTLLAFAPGLRRALPKPGPWMERAKIVLAFPMFGTAAWLAWVLAAQAGPNGLLALLALLTVIAFFVVVARWGTAWRIAGAVALIAIAAIAWRPLTAPPPAEATLTAQAWTPARVEALRAEGRGVFVDFTAAWCVTCQVNKITVLSRPRVAAAFNQANVTFLEADWTNPNPEIAAALAAFGRDGVPLYLYYPPGESEARVLPQVLTEDIVINALRAGGSGDQS